MILGIIKRKKDLIIVICSWVVTILLVLGLLILCQKFCFTNEPEEIEDDPIEPQIAQVSLPEYLAEEHSYTIPRLTNVHTSFPENNRADVDIYNVEEGDSIFSIAKKYDVKAETILWANYDLLHDDPTFLSPGWSLLIPPIDGIYYEWQEGDTLQKVSEKYLAQAEDIILFPGNGLDIHNPQTDSLQYIMVPGGSREIVSWIVPLAFSPQSGATRTIAGPGGCQIPDYGPVGSTAFIWPVSNHYLSGFGFSSYHLGIDVAASVGTPVWASDSGTVIYAGWNDSGYGNLIVIDHNNGYSTVYAHLNSLNVGCGDYVSNGQPIGYSGSTGKSTGGHLHFEIRFNSGFIDPWQMLP